MKHRHYASFGHDLISWFNITVPRFDLPCYFQPPLAEFRNKGFKGNFRGLNDAPF